MSVVLRAWLLGSLLAVAAVGSGCGGAPTLAADVRARALGFEAHAGAVPRWSRWGRVGDLRFLEVVVGTDEVDATLPMVLALHGFADGPRVPDGPYLGRARPYRMVLPEGPVEVAAGRAWSAWRVLDERPDELAYDLDAQVAPLVELVEILRIARPTRGRPVLLGYSQGGHLALTLAVRSPRTFARAIPMAAWLPPALLPAAPPEVPLPIRGVHARDDERVPIALTEAVYGALAERGWDAQLEIVPGAHAPTAAVDAFAARELDVALLALDP
jgi:phospholipase/carboxylesterase